MSATLISIPDMETLVRQGGLILIFLIIYGSVGLFFLFFLPSGAILFTTGVLTANGDLPFSVFGICSLLVVATFLGNMTGYGIGRRTGQLFYNRADSRFFKQQYLQKAELFYENYGWVALSVGMYLPIVRSFAPVVAGIVKMNIQRFVWVTLAGSILFVLSFVLAGYYIGTRPYLKPWLPYIVGFFILVITLPLIIKMIKEFRKL
jgi:membrane-associated protein